jgi:hypothetical protein
MKRWAIVAGFIAVVAVALYVGAVIAANVGFVYRLPRISN